MAKLRGIKVLELLAPATRTASANGTGVDLQSSITNHEYAAYLSVGAQSGTTPTLDVKIQDSDDNSTFADITGAAFAQVGGATATPTALYFRTNKRYVRAVSTLAGTSPSYTFAVELLTSATLV